jgi:hypothetical protein
MQKNESRKTIKITLPADKVEAFAKAKTNAESAAMITLTDTQYASRLIQWALDRQSENVAALVLRQDGDNTKAIIEGKHGTKAHDWALRASYLLECDWTGEPVTI